MAKRQIGTTIIMAQIVELPNGDTVEFPDEMGAAAFSSAISQSFPEFSPQPSGRTAGDVISDAGTMLHKVLLALIRR